MRSALADPRAALVRVSLALFVYWIVGFVVAMSADWPSEFDREASDDPETFVQWVVRGSLLAAPLLPVVVQAVATVLASRRQRWAVLVGATLLLLLAVVYTIGTLGEPLDLERSDPPLLVYVAFRVVGLSLLLALFATAALTLARWARGRG